MAGVLTIEDLENGKKHSTFYAEVVTGKTEGLPSGPDISVSTNQVTGQIQKTLPQVLADLGMVVQTWTATSGGTLTNVAQVFLNDKVGSSGLGNYYAWSGTFPKVVPAGIDPSITAGFVQRSDAKLRSDINIVKKRFSSVAEMKSSIKLGDEGKLIEWLSYYSGWAATSIGANGGNKGIVVPAGTGTADEGSLFDTNSGLQVKALFDNKNITFAHFGADYTKTTDSTSRINAAFAFAKSSKIPVRESVAGSFLVSGQIVCEAPVNYYGLPSEGELGTGTEFYWTGNDDTVDVFYAKPSTNYKFNMRDVHNVTVHAETTTVAGTSALLIDRKCRSLIRYDGGHVSVKNLRATSFNSADNFAGPPPALIGIWAYKAYSYNMEGHNYAHGCAIGFLNNDIDITSANIDNLYVQNNIACFVAYAPNGMNIGALSAEGSNVRWRVVAGNYSGGIFMTGLNIGGLYAFGNSVNIQKGIYVQADIRACLNDVDTQVLGRLSAALVNAGSSINFTPSTSYPFGFHAAGIVQGNVDIQADAGCVPDLFVTSGFSVLNVPTLQKLLSFDANGTITPKFVGYGADYRVKAAGADYGFLEKKMSLSATAGETIIGSFSLSATNSKQVEISGDLLIQGSGDSVGFSKRFTAALTTPGGVVTVSLIGETASDIHIRAKGGADIISSATTTVTSVVGAMNIVYEVYIPNISRAVCGTVKGFKPTTSSTCSVLGTSI